MTAFIKKCSVFGLILAVTMITPLAIINNSINTGRYFVLPPTTTTLMLGSSTAAMSLNDNLIDHSVNMALDGVSYYYKYYQLKKLLDDNPHIERLILDIPSYVLTKDSDEWIYAPETVLREMPKIACTMPAVEQLGLCMKAPEPFLLSQKNVLILNVNFLKLVKREGEGSFIHYADWGRYIESEDSRITLLKENATQTDLPDSAPIIGEELKWLKRCVHHAQAQDVEVILIHSPRHSLAETSNPHILPTDDYHQLIANEFPDTHFRDYSGFPLSDTDFVDFIHLNKHGAARFSEFLNSQLQDISSNTNHILHSTTTP